MSTRRQRSDQRRGFVVWIDNDRLSVRFVGRRQLGHLKSGHQIGGDYGQRGISLLRSESLTPLRKALLHEIGHYLINRQELVTHRGLAKDVTEEDVCDLLCWLPIILEDPRNVQLRAFLGLTYAGS